jgi:hypothetical protein
MPQVALPRSDIFDNGWTPTPVYSQLDAGSPVTSSTNPQGDSFEVKLDALAYPDSGPQTLTVRLQATGSPPFPNVTILLLQGTRVIAYQIVQPTAAFADYTITLSADESRWITDYTDLRVEVRAGLALTTGCSQLPNGAAQSFILYPTGITPNLCPACDELNRLALLTYVSGCLWRQDPQEVVCGSLLWQLQGMGNGVWQLRNGLVIYQVTAPAWDGQSPLTLPLTVGPASDGPCLNYPGSLTVTPV